MKVNEKTLEQINIRKQAVIAGQIRQQMCQRELNMFVVEQLKELGLDTSSKSYEISQEGEVIEVKREKVEEAKEDEKDN